MFIEIKNKGKHAGEFELLSILKARARVGYSSLACNKTLCKEGVIAKLALIVSGCKVLSVLFFISFSGSKGAGSALGLALLTCLKDNLKGRTCVGETT